VERTRPLWLSELRTLRITNGESKSHVVRAESGSEATLSFVETVAVSCSHSLLAAAGSSGSKLSLDDPSWFTPTADVWVSSA
jgi:hypothetical protein